MVAAADLDQIDEAGAVTPKKMAAPEPTWGQLARSETMSLKPLLDIFCETALGWRQDQSPTILCAPASKGLQCQ